MSSSEKTIGLLNEKSLHAALKEWVFQPGDKAEERCGRYTIDIIRGDLLIEIQTSNFSQIRPKITKLIEHHPVRLIYPIAREKWIVRQTAEGERISRRRSPRQGRIEDLFREFVRLPALLKSENFCLQILMIQEEEIRQKDHKRGWRRGGWVVVERRLIQVVESFLFNHPSEMSALLPGSLERPFTAKDLGVHLHLPTWQAQKMIYCLRSMDLIVPIGKRGRAILYQDAEPDIS